MLYLKYLSSEFENRRKNYLLSLLKSNRLFLTFNFSIMSLPKKIICNTFVRWWQCICSRYRANCFPCFTEFILHNNLWGQALFLFQFYSGRELGLERLITLANVTKLGRRNGVGGLDPAVGASESVPMSPHRAAAQCATTEQGHQCSSPMMTTVNLPVVRSPKLLIKEGNLNLWLS